jgi:hypothetical protein
MIGNTENETNNGDTILMSARSPQIIFESIVRKQGKNAKLRNKLSANREWNWLLRLVLHSFAKLAR